MVCFQWLTLQFNPSVVEHRATTVSEPEKDWSVSKTPGIESHTRQGLGCMLWLYDVGMQHIRQQHTYVCMGRRVPYLAWGGEK